jgi:hypothetical protein
VTRVKSLHAAAAESSTAPRLHDAGQPNTAAGQTGDLPVPVQGARVHARVLDRAGSAGHLRWRARPFCLPRHGRRQHPVKPTFAARWLAYACLCQRFTSHLDAPRMTRGQHDSSGLCCAGLSPATPCRFAPAHPRFGSLADAALDMSRCPSRRFSVDSPRPGAMGDSRLSGAGREGAPVGARHRGLEIG